MIHDIFYEDPKDELLNRCKVSIQRLECELREERNARKHLEHLFAETVDKIQEISSLNLELNHTIENSRAQIRSLERQLKNNTFKHELSAKVKVLQEENLYLIKKLKEKDQFILELKKRMTDLSSGEVLSKENQELRDSVFELTEKLNQMEELKNSKEFQSPFKQNPRTEFDLTKDLNFHRKIHSLRRISNL